MQLGDTTRSALVLLSLFLFLTFSETLRAQWPLAVEIGVANMIENGVIPQGEPEALPNESLPAEPQQPMPTEPAQAMPEPRPAAEAEPPTLDSVAQEKEQAAAEGEITEGPPETADSLLKGAEGIAMLGSLFLMNRLADRLAGGNLDPFNMRERSEYLESVNRVKAHEEKLAERLRDSNISVGDAKRLATVIRESVTVQFHRRESPRGDRGVGDLDSPRPLRDVAPLGSRAPRETISERAADPNVREVAGRDPLTGETVAVEVYEGEAERALNALPTGDVANGAAPSGAPAVLPSTISVLASARGALSRAELDVEVRAKVDVAASARNGAPKSAPAATAGGSEAKEKSLLDTVKDALSSFFGDDIETAPVADKVTDERRLGVLYPGVLPRPGSRRPIGTSGGNGPSVDERMDLPTGGHVSQLAQSVSDNRGLYTVFFLMLVWIFVEGFRWMKRLSRENRDRNARALDQGIDHAVVRLRAGLPAISARPQARPAYRVERGWPNGLWVLKKNGQAVAGIEAGTVLLGELVSANLAGRRLRLGEDGKWYETNEDVKLVLRELGDTESPAPGWNVA